MNRRMSRESLTGTILTDSIAERTAELTRRNPIREALTRNRDYSAQLLPIGEIGIFTSSNFFSSNIVFISIQGNLDAQSSNVSKSVRGSQMLRSV
jgi:hypothetical protein